MMFNSTQFIIGTAFSLIVSGAAWKLKSLSLSGALAALLMGSIVFGLGGLSWAIILLIFFISSSLLSKVFKQRKQSFEEKFSKSSTRDIWQVLANGGIGTLCLIALLIFPAETWLWWAFCAAFSAANADTWATELGVLSKRSPRLIINGRLVAPGTSGGISLMGTLASLSGAGVIALFAVLLAPSPQIINPIGSFIVISLAGLFGSLIDSLLGATIQAIYYCPVCEKETERHPQHLCGNPTLFKKGWAFMNNDWVNTICALSASLFTIISWVIFS